MQGTLRGIAPVRHVVAVLAVALVWVSFTARAHNPHDPVMAIGVSPDYATDQTLFVSTFSELNWGYKDMLRSTDGGVSWSKMPKGMDNRNNFSAIRLSPGFSLDGAVYAATRGDGVYASTDRGDSWQLINTGLSGLNIGELKIAGSPHTDYVIFAAPTTGGLHRRAASANAWTSVLAQSVKLAVVAPSPDFSADATVLTADLSGNLRISTDGGHTWVGRGNPAASVVHDIAIAPGGAREIFLATGRPGLFYSNDAGASFVSKVANLPAEPVNNVAVSPNYAADRTVFCTTQSRAVYRSTNGGNGWTLYQSGARITGQTTLIKEFAELQVSNTYVSDGAVFLSAFDGLYASSNAGTVWRELQTRNSLVTGLAFSSDYAADSRVMATTYFNGGVHSSTDGGTTWTRVWDGWSHPGNTLSAFDIDFLRNHAGAPMAMASKNFTQIGFTSDFGASWSIRSIPNLTIPGQAARTVYPNVMSLSPDFDSDQEIYLGTRRHGVIQSLDGGLSWRTNRGVPTSQEIMATAISPNYANDHIAMAATWNGEVWRTINGGDSWSRVGSAVIRMRVGLKFPSIAFSPNFAVDRLVLVGTNDGVYASTDGGSAWLIVDNADIGRARVVRQIEFSPDFATDGQLFATVRGRGLFRMTMSAGGAVTSSTNIGETLLDQHVEFTEFRLSPAYSQDGTILGASRRGVYRTTDAGATWSLAGTPGD